MSSAARPAPPPVKRPSSGLARAAHNLASLPRRSLRGVTRLFDPDYRFEARARRDVRRWLSADERRRLSQVSGMTATAACELLAWLAANSPTDGCVLEIGAWHGKSTAWLVAGTRQRSQSTAVVSIDPHARGSWDTFQQTVSTFDLERSGLEVIRESSHRIGRTWSRPIGLLWIDGSHEYEDVAQDIDDFAPHVVPGGWVVFDDVNTGRFPGVERAVAERIGQRPGFHLAHNIKHFALYRRVGAMRPDGEGLRKK